MKKLVLASLFAAVAATSFGQGTIGGLEWGNFKSGLFAAPVYGPEVGNAGLSISGQSSIGNSVGSTVYTGPLLVGTGYSMSIYFGPAGAADSGALTLLGTTTFRTSTTTPQALPKGLVLGNTVNVPGTIAGQTIKFQMRAWDNAGGTITSWADATTRGASAMVTSGQLGGTDASNAIFLNPFTTGWTSFNIYTVPEPSTFVLAGLDAAGLLIFRRRN